ncbi:MAG: hypothetical protein IJX14_11865 [Clostridia bacterium]|nr:hypothetical protein [Clostridia bacterium]
MNKPQILLIGDSIRMGYCETVKADLAEKADVIFPNDNCRCTHYVLETLNGWVGLTDPAQVIAVHFNCGHWDAAHFGGDPDPLTPLDEYARNLRRILWRLHRHFPAAKVYFATTTPMNPSRIPDGNPRTTGEIREYNRVGLAVMAEEGIPVNDLFALTENWGEETFRDACHFTDEANVQLGHAVSGFLTGQLGL